MHLRSYAFAQPKTEEEDVMKELLNQLKALDGIEQRSSISVIRELNQAIKRAQSSGYRVASIHQKIADFMVINLESFKTLLYRVRKEDRIKQHEKELPVLHKPQIKAEPKEVKATENLFEYSKDNATQRSKHKLAQFGKGK
jgi:hypothetical protein